MCMCICIYIWIGSRIVKRRLDFANWKIEILAHVLSSWTEERWCWEGDGRRREMEKEMEQVPGHDRGTISHPLGGRLVA